MVPADAVPGGKGSSESLGFVSLLVTESGTEKFVAAFARDSAKEADNKLTFYWNSKAPYYDSNAPMKANYFKDGPHTLKVQVHNVEGRTIDFATVDVNIQNKVARSNPAPPVTLVNKLSFGQVNTYGVRADVEVFEVVARVGLPILGGLGVNGEYKIIQSVEDVRPDGQLLLRYRIGEDAYVSSGGVKALLYKNLEIKPQLYRLVTKYGKVVDRNLFTKQARFTIMDVLPVLPANPVKEGDSWPDRFTVKMEGLTPLTTLEGTSQLDSFEWQSGEECAKIISRLNGQMPIALAGGKIQSSGPVTAEVTTYFAYRIGRMVKRDINLEFPASIAPGAGEAGAFTESALEAPVPMPMPTEPMYNEPIVGEMNEYPRSRRSSSRPSTTATTPTTKKGTIRISIVVRLEK